MSYLVRFYIKLRCTLSFPWYTYLQTPCVSAKTLLKHKNTDIFLVVLYSINNFFIKKIEYTDNNTNKYIFIKLFIL